MGLEFFATAVKLSVIIPAYNEEESLPNFWPDLIKGVEEAVSSSYEVIFVNDGSTDSTLDIIRKLAAKNDRVCCLSLSRNFGKEIATTAGIFQAKGEASLIIDADGQHPPKLIKEFVKQWQSGYDVVIGVRKSNKREGFVKRYGSKLFYRLFNKTGNVVLLPGATDFRLIDSSVSNEFRGFTERNRITRGIIDWMGFRRTTIAFHANERLGGKATYKFSKLFELALNSFVSLSVAPLYAISYVGLAITAGSFMAGTFVIIEQLILSDPLRLHVTGTAMLVILTLFLVGIILVSQGLLAIYLSHIHSQTQNRPLFIVDRKNSIKLG